MSKRPPKKNLWKPEAYEIIMESRGRETVNETQEHIRNYSRNNSIEENRNPK